jgi:uncharacterized membrane protein (DUF485 family)
VLLQTKVSIDDPRELAAYVQDYLGGPLLQAAVDAGVLLAMNTFRIKTSIRTNN